jgi:hypothetical protein
MAQKASFTPLTQNNQDHWAINLASILPIFSGLIIEVLHQPCGDGRIINS